MWHFATKEIESAKNEKSKSKVTDLSSIYLAEEKSVKSADIILNTGADDDFGTVIRRPKNCILTPPESKDWKIEVQSNPVVDEQVGTILIGVYCKDNPTERKFRSPLSTSESMKIVEFSIRTVMMTVHLTVVLAVASVRMGTTSQYGRLSYGHRPTAATTVI